MRIKLRLRDPDRPPEDVLVVIEEETAIEVLAEALAALRPGRSGRGRDSGRRGPPIARRAGPDRRTSLVVLRDGERSAPIDPGAAVAAAPIASGDIVEIVAVEHPAAPEVRAMLRVRAGPATGAEFPLAPGVTEIGRAADAGVVIADRSISMRHARIEVGETIDLIDLNSANGIVVDGDYVTRVRMVDGAAAWLGDTAITVEPRSPAGDEGPEQGSPVGAARAADAFRAGPVRFNRAPHLEPVFAGVELEPPRLPPADEPTPFPWIALAAPLAMGLGLLVIPGASAFRLLFVVLAPLVAAATFLGQLLAQRSRRRRAIRRFDEGLASLEARLERAHLEERRARESEAPPLAELLAALDGLRRPLWARRPDEFSFLTVRLGLGDVPARSRVRASPEPPTAAAAGAPEESLRACRERFERVQAAAVAERLSDAGSIGIAGSARIRDELAAGILLQLALLHAPGELRIAALLGADRARSFDWLKWLPHVDVDADAEPSSDPAPAFRADPASIASALERLVEARAGPSNDSARPEGPDEPRPMPAFVVLVDDEVSIERPRLVHIAERGPAVGVHVLWLAGSESAVPAACRTFVAVAALVPRDASASPPIGDIPVEAAFARAGTRQAVVAELVPFAVAEAAAMRLARLVDANAPTASVAAMPRSVALSSLLGEDLLRSPAAVIDRWRSNDSILDRSERRPHRPAKLRALVGRSEGDAVHLDLREHGPHALVGGTTGSGKSEFLRSWILSMAAELSPDRLSLLLVDYKGGAAFAECGSLPHCVGTVTDLDPSLVRRALLSLRAELRHRERLFAEHGFTDLVDFEASGDAACPPVLVIVVDEFAALVEEFPDFIEGILDLAKRGRSLGIHLILATQRPAGVVRDSLRANTSLRIALRMADVHDSIDVVGAATAAEFAPDTPGRAVAAFAPGRRVVFQSAFAGGGAGSAPQRPTSRVEVVPLRPGAAARRDEGRAPAVEPSRVAPGRRVVPGPSELETMAATIRSAALAARVPSPRRPWLDPLPEVLAAEALVSAEAGDMPFGLLDDPGRQAHRLAVFRPERDLSLMILGMPGSGKSVLLRTLAAAACRDGGELEIFGIDCASRGLAPLEALPQVGGIVDGDDLERIERLLARLTDELDARSANAHAPAARILLLIDGMGEFRTRLEHAASPAFDRLRRVLAEGPKLGMHVVLTADRPAAIPSSFHSLIGSRVILRLADEHDRHSPAAGIATPVETPPGRGSRDGFELQTAILGGSATQERHAIEALATRLVAAGCRRVAGVGRLPTQVSLTELQAKERSDLGGRDRRWRGELRPGPHAPRRLAMIGIDGDSLAPLGIEPAGSFLVSGPPGSGRSTALRTLVMAGLDARPDAMLCVIAAQGAELADLVGLAPWQTAATAQEANRLAGRLLPVASEQGARPLLLVIQDAAELLGNHGDPDLAALVRAARRGGHFVIAEGETSTLAPGWPGLAELKNARRGLALRSTPLEIESLYRTPVPRAGVPQAAGRGHLIERGLARIVQIAMPER